MKGRLMLWTVPYMLIAASVLQVSSGALCDFTPPGTAQLFEYSPPATVVLELTVEGTPEVNISLSLDSVLSEFFEWNEKKLLTKSGQNITKPADTDASGLISGEARCFLVGNALPEEIISLRVNVIDINQVNPIEFSQSSYTETFAESAAINDTFFQVVATDPDVDSSDITYNITEQNPPDYFSLARSNLGNVYLRKQLDYRDVQRIVMTIEASSSGADGKEGIWKDTTTVQATVMVDDEDNYPPQFNPCQLVSGNVCFPPLYTTSVKRYQINVLDNIQPGPISAEDLDAGVNAAISYSFISGDHDEYFAIDSSNGEVTMKKEINDPNISQFTISVRAEEATGKSSFAYFVVDVTTADDFKPIFEENSYSGFIQDNSQNLYSIVTKDEDGTIPLQIKAADPDDGNAEILYQITSPFQVTSDGYVYYSPSSSAPFATTIPDGEVTAINLNADVGSSNRRSDPIVLTVIAIEPATDEGVTSQSTIGVISTSGSTQGLEEPGEPTTCSPSPSCPEITTGEGEVILPPGTVSASTLYGVAGGLGAGLLICIIIIIVIGSFLYKRSKSPPDTESFVSTTASSTHHNNTAFEDEISPNGKVPHEEIPESTYVMAADVEPVAETTETTVNDDTTSPAHQYENVVPETRTPEPEVVEPEYQPINVETEVPEPPAEESEAPAAFTSFAAVPAVPVAAKVYSNLPDPFFDDGEIQDYGSAFKRNQIRIEKILAEGKYGETRLVTIEKYGIERKDTKAVAKILKLNIAPGTHVSSCHAQIGLMKEACEQEHDNILQFCGMLENENEIHCAMAYTPNGTLENYLKPGANHSKLTANQMMRIISGVAKGLQFLHAKNIVHCNLQSRSIMLDEELMPKLRDYENNEVSAIKEDDDRLRWQALEVLNGDLSNTGSDIWSCGVVMWHVASRGETPYTKVEDKDIIPHLTNNYRLTKPSGCSQSLFGLMESCWNADPRLRPDIYVIVTNLEEKLMEDANELFGLDVSSNLDPTYVNITVEGSTSNHSVLSSFKNVDEDSTML